MPSQLDFPFRFFEDSVARFEQTHFVFSLDGELVELR